MIMLMYDKNKSIGSGKTLENVVVYGAYNALSTWSKSFPISWPLLFFGVDGFAVRTKT